MSHVMLFFIAMPFLGVRIGVPMLSGTGTGNIAPVTFTPSLNFSDARNSQYLILGMI